MYLITIINNKMNVNPLVVKFFLMEKNIYSLNKGCKSNNDLK